MPFDPLRPVVWRGELVALAGRERFHIISPRLRSPDATADELEYVALLCVYQREMLLGHLPRCIDPDIAARWVDTLLELRSAGVSR
jgi:hypothetical protein